MSLYKKLLAGVAATAAFILPGDFSARKPEAPAVQNGLEAILNSDWIEETSVPNIFEKPTEADELTINTLKTYINDYYKKLDKLVDAGKNFDE
ncbi:MAG: hypothetical protein NTW67_03095, partial [Candidatus Woesearchaeota archaeon]|nr:hypothetical protein [Candidatus Woesearchaeota archaeon]